MNWRAHNRANRRNQDFHKDAAFKPKLHQLRPVVSFFSLYSTQNNKSATNQSLQQIHNELYSKCTIHNISTYMYRYRTACCTTCPTNPQQIEVSEFGPMDSHSVTLRTISVSLNTWYTHSALELPMIRVLSCSRRPSLSEFWSVPAVWRWEEVVSRLAAGCLVCRASVHSLQLSAFLLDLSPLSHQL